MSERERLYPQEVESRWSAYDWKIIPPVPREPAMNLALDEVLTAKVGAGESGPILRFWGWSRRAVILGRFQSVANETHPERAEDLDIQIVRRISGGGAMLVEPESAITYSIYTPPEFVEGLSFPESYAFFDSWVINTLRELGIDAWYEPLNDLTSAGGKIGGAAQARRYGGVLHHTTMAYDMTEGLLLEVLRIGQEKISDKGIRSADRRVGPLRQQTQMARDDIIERMTDHFMKLTGGTLGELTDEELQMGEKLYHEKFTTKEWTYLLP